MMRGITGLLAALLLAVGLQPSASAAQTPEEVISFESLTLTDDQFLRGAVERGSPVSLTGKLQLPALPEGPAPAVILLHGSNGPGSGVVWNWAKVLHRMGVATFKIDSYTGRGHEEIFTSQGRIGEFNNIVDTFRGLDVLAADPRIDKNRIAVMGFSRGGVAALYSSLIRFEQIYGSRRAKLAAHLPFYPPCNYALERELEIGTAPVRAFHGDADMWNPLPRCRDYLDRLKAAGGDVELFVYPGGQHAFDDPGSPAYNVVSDAQTSRRCFRREENGTLLNAETGKPFTWQDDCVELGPVVQFNSAAASAAERDVKAFLTEVFGLN